MALIDKKILNPIRYHQDNANTVIGQASTMKALFDQGAEDLRVKLNGVIDELLATTGAQQIGIDPAKGLGNTLADALTNIKDYMNLGASSISAEVIGTGSGDNVQAQLLWLMNQIKTMVLGQIPEGTISIDKLTIELANLINEHTTQLAQRVNKAGDTMTGNLNVPSINNKPLAYAVAPTEIAITSGFATGWAGSISYRKNQENLVTLTINIVKSTDIALGQHLLFTLPTGVRPSDRATIFTNIHTSGGIPVQNASATITVIWDGSINLYTMPGATLTNARYLNNVVLSYYAV